MITRRRLFELLKQADLAMYAAKAAGHNTLRFYAEHVCRQTFEI